MINTNGTSSNKPDEQLVKLAIFENRWRYAVFPAMIAFIMLSAFGFYLIWGMLERMQALSADIDRMTTVISKSLPKMEQGVTAMSSRMEWVGADLDLMSKDVKHLTSTIADVMPKMEQRINDIAININNMSYSTAAMAATTDSMGRNIWAMNRSISKPMSFMSDMMPWQRNSSVPPPPQSRYTQLPRPVIRYASPVQTVTQTTENASEDTPAIAVEEQEFPPGHPAAN